MDGTRLARTRLSLLALICVSFRQRFDRRRRVDRHLSVARKDDDSDVGAAEDGELGRLLHDTELALGEGRLPSPVVPDPRNLNLATAHAEDRPGRRPEMERPVSSACFRQLDVRVSERFLPGFSLSAGSFDVRPSLLLHTGLSAAGRSPRGSTQQP